MNRSVFIVISSLCLGVALIGAFSSASARQPDNLCLAGVEYSASGAVEEPASAVPGSVDRSQTGGDASAVITVEECTVDEMAPEQPAATDNYRNAGGDGDDAVVTVSGDAGDNCVELFAPYSSDPNVSYTPYCVKWRVCGGERVDDIVSGEIAGEEADGRYRSYLDQIVGLLEGAIDLGPTAPVEIMATDPNSVSEFLLEQGLDDRPEDDLLPVFYWCADYVESGGTRLFDPVDLGAVSFGWDLTYGEVYDIPGATNALYTQLQARLDLYEPDIGLVPDAEVGYTFVQWPTWLFLQNPSEDIMLFSTNSTDTLRVDLRAKLVGVDWGFGDQIVDTCLASEMTPFVDGLDPIEDLPDCHFIFTQLDCQNLTATTRFKIEQMVRTRPSSTGHDYPPVAWTDFLGTPTEIALSSTIENYQVHEILAVNTPQGVTREEMIMQGRASGQIPEQDQICQTLATRAG